MTYNDEEIDAEMHITAKQMMTHRENVRGSNLIFNASSASNSSQPEPFSIA